jgi:arylsulfatase A-like enzyme
MKTKTKQLSTLLTGTSLLLSGCAASVSGDGSAQPNIIFILADDLGSADVGAYGSEYIRTPNIDRLAAEGLSFTQAYAGASVSSPSRCTFLTGLHTGHARIRSNFARQGGIEGKKGKNVIHRPNLLPQDSTIAGVLSNNGYHTILINKWHVDGFDTTAHPLNRGFREFYGWLVPEPRSHNHYPEVRYRNYEKYDLSENLNNRRALHATDIATDEAVEFIRRTKDNQKHQEPFFLFLTYNAPHTPLHAKSLEAYKDADLPENDKAYASLVTHLDEAIGRVLDEVKRTGIEEKTVVIFASDNGGSTEAQLEKIRQNGALRGYKGQLYEGGLRVPLIIKTGDKSIAGKKSDFPAYFPDLFATLVELAGAHTTLQTDGVSLLPEIQSPNSLDASQRTLYWEQYPSRGLAQAVRKGEWKLIRQNVQAEYELYNLKDDPSETTNLALRYPDIVSNLAVALKEAHTESEWWPVGEF